MENTIEQGMLVTITLHDSDDRSIHELAGCTFEGHAGMGLNYSKDGIAHWVPASRVYRVTAEEVQPTR